MVSIPDQDTASSNRQNEIVSLLEGVTRALVASDHQAALRLSDRLYRIAGGEPDVAHIHARALIQVDRPAEALAVLEKAAQARPDRRIIGEIIGLLLRLGKMEAARARLSDALVAFAVTPDDELAVLAGQVLDLSHPLAAGWVGRGPDLSVWGELAPGAALEPERDILLSPQPNGRARFTLATAPAGWSATSNGRPLLGRSGAYPADFGLEGHCQADENTLSGFVRLAWGDSERVLIEVEAQGVISTTHLDAPLPSGYRPFSFSAPPGIGPIRLSVRLPDGRKRQLPGSPLVRDVEPFSLAADHTQTRPPDVIPARPPVCIIAALDSADRGAALDLVKALIATTPSDVNLLMVVPGEDRELTRDLQRCAQRRRLYVLQSDPATGWAGAVNCGLDVARHRDVVILSPDLHLPPNWLERLARAAYARPDLGTASPLTSGAETLEPAQALWRDELASRLTQIDAQAGFIPSDACLYIRADCGAATGLLDPSLFATAQGALSDFCLRAAACGWRGATASDLFLGQKGAASRASRRDDLARDRTVLARRHPSSPVLTARSDGSRLSLRRLDEARLRAMEVRFALIITLSLPGGVGRCIAERCVELRRAGLTPLSLKPDGAGRAVLTIADDEHAVGGLAYEGEADQDALIALVESLPLAHIELHHFLDHAPRLIERLLARDCGYEVYIHDNVWVCPRIMLLGGDGYYCAEPPIAACETCLSTHGGSLETGLSVTALRARSADWLARARRVIAPSRDAAARVTRYFPHISPQVQNWEAPPAVRRAQWPVRAPGQPVKVAIVGAIGPWKGYQLVLDCARDAVARGLELEFVIIGYTHDDATLMQTGAVFVTGEYGLGELDGLLTREAPDIALISSLAPETWSYALTEILSTGLQVAALDIGAVPERLKAYGQPCLLAPLPPSAPALNDALISFARSARHGRADEEADGNPVQAPLSPPLATDIPSAMDGVDVSGSNLSRDSQIPAADAPSYSKHSSSPVYPYDEQTKRAGEALMPKSSSGLLSSADVLTLDAGLYVFTVKDASPVRLGEDKTLVLPAVHVGLGPGVEEGTVDFMSGLRNGAGWLFERHDVLVVRVNRSGSHLMLTSVRRPGMAALKIDVERMDAERVSDSTAPTAARAAPSAQLAGPAPIRAQINLRIEGRGVTAFMENGWAGAIGQQSPIDAFSVLPLEALPADCVQYKALTAHGVETPWTSGGALCGVAGAAPLIGFAVRLAKGAETQFDVSYRGAFHGGGLVGPVLNGGACQIPSTNALLEAIEVRIVRRMGPQQALPGAPPRPVAAAPAQIAPPPKPQPAAPMTAAAAPPMPQPGPGPASAPGRGRTIGPKFSIFRDETP